MNHKISLIVILLFNATFAIAQSPSKQHYLDLYKRAIKYNDKHTAITALNGYLTLGEDAAYKDTLGFLYYLNEEYFSSLLLTKESYDANPNNSMTLERLAECYNQLGDTKAAMEYYEKLCPKTKNPYHYYKLATVQYQLKKTAECRSSLQIVIADTSSKNIGTAFSSGNGQSQNVSVLAAAYNMLGVTEMDAKNNAKAIEYLNKAITAFPGFIGAKENLAVLKGEASKNKSKTN